ncbi:MAG: bifunctional 23S rRNA (guanine(2069)-N(7))-methyltransferase RlmK/23S rRNA (guanine(2445)-N(2))-methyltransferase RlmL [Gammaproteobacteria bacterium]|nr:bifunctional 23S rRNA (guanine(2069)-N(7))-methyltransferase RlmK/23S rRNA (guanine(2445)-N(2))-methyltransferase RlmL [Gammaproteobacteria bacterium]
MSNLLQNYISCPKGIESLLLDELLALGEYSLLKQHIGGLYGNASLQTLYRICLCSRLANRVLLQLDSRKIENKECLRDWLLNVDWSKHMSVEQSLHIRFFGELPDIQHTQYGAQFAKDAIVDYFRARGDQRPSVDREQPDLRFQINIDKQQAGLYLDLSGESLHQRGYRQGVTTAPLKENLAAALLIRAQWPQIAQQGGALVDPLCGSGTLITEAALIAANIAPGLFRKRFGFDHWRQHKTDLWQIEIENARSRISRSIPPIIGYDEDARALGIARQHIGTLALGESEPRVYKKSLQEWKKPSHIDLKPGLLITNPPYGERIGDKDKLADFYKLLGQKWINECPDWHAALFTADPQLAKATRMYWSKSYVLYNGALKCQLYLLEPARGLKQDLSEEMIAQKKLDGIDIQSFTNRLRKNQQRLGGWLKQNNIECYRLYFADIPEFAVAIDIYRDWAVVQEYQAPKNIDPEKATQRLQALLLSLPSTLSLKTDHIVFKQRRRQKGKTQYEKLEQRQEFLQVNEGNVRLLVDLHSYLDTGLFLDHRPIRLQLAKICSGKRMLNLFCYTAAATVHAAGGGARETVSIDMSKTYIDWAKRNFALNKMDILKHKLIQADVLDWLENQTEQFDVVLLDPPTFSNSKRMQETLDIQRDHIELINSTMRCVDNKGVLLFSCNFKKFRLDPEICSRYRVNDITDWSIPRDFDRLGKIHYCYEIRRIN